MTLKELDKSSHLPNLEDNHCLGKCRLTQSAPGETSSQLKFTIAWTFTKQTSAEPTPRKASTVSQPPRLTPQEGGPCH